MNEIFGDLFSSAAVTFVHFSCDINLDGLSSYMYVMAAFVLTIVILNIFIYYTPPQLLSC